MEPPKQRDSFFSLLSATNNYNVGDKVRLENRQSREDFTPTTENRLVKKCYVLCNFQVFYDKQI